MPSYLVIAGSFVPCVDRRRVPFHPGPGGKLDTGPPALYLVAERWNTAMKQAICALLLVSLLPSWGLAQERIKFPVGVSSKVLGYGHLWAAWRLKYFEREGLDVDVVLMRGTAPAVQALIAGSISVGLVANDGPSQPSNRGSI
jgi:hypothetical protein